MLFFDMMWAANTNQRFSEDVERRAVGSGHAATFVELDHFG
jgi:hypothetical protein